MTLGSTHSQPTVCSPPVKDLLLVLFSVWVSVTVLHGWLKPSDSHGGWVNCVLQNWREYGYRELNGKPVTNPGGADVRTEPQVYRGYRAFSLLPIHGLHLLTGSLRAAYWIWASALTALLLATIWWFFGRSWLTPMVGAAVCLSPGYLRACADWDPIPMTLLLGLPVVAVMLTLVAGKDGLAWRWAIVGAVVAGYALLEWSVVLALFIGWATMGAMLWREQRARFLWGTLILAGAVLLGTVSLILQKTGRSHSGGSVIQFALNYGFGSAYEGATMTWGLAVKRLLVVNLIGLLPLWGFYLWMLGAALRERGREVWVAVIPVVAAWTGVFGLRNPMAHHQWIPTSAVTISVVASLYLLLRQGHSPRSMGLLGQPLVRWGVMAASVVYAIGIGEVLRFNSQPMHSLVGFVQQHTPRNALIVIGPGLEPAFAPGSQPGILFDRSSCGLRDPLLASKPHALVYVLDRHPLTGFGEPVATNQVRNVSWVSASLEWYRRHIVKRREGTRAEYGAAHYLYRWMPSPRGAVNGHPLPHP